MAYLSTVNVDACVSEPPRSIADTLRQVRTNVDMALRMAMRLRYTLMGDDLKEPDDRQEARCMGDEAQALMEQSEILQKQLEIIMQRLVG